MLSRMKMLGRVLVLRGIAAANVSTNQAFAEMNPGVSGLQTLFAAIGTGCDLFDLVEMGTFRCHVYMPSFRHV